ncbi:MAG: hypothetical protein WD733_13790 [Bryobacterales bacterium]
MRTISVSVVVGMVLAGSLALAQNSSSKTRPGDSSNAIGKEQGEKPEAVLRIVKVKGKISAVDLEERTITVDPGKKDKEDDLKLNFAQPTGREQIKVSKKAEKVLGKKRLKLEELKVGSEVSLEYYPLLGQLMELTVEQPVT